MEGGWPALVTAAASAIRAGKIRPNSLAKTLASEHSPTARTNFARLTADVPTSERVRPTTRPSILPA